MPQSVKTEVSWQLGRYQYGLEVAPHQVAPEYRRTLGSFAYIAGYTAAGFAYGVTWEEWEALDVIDLDGKTNTTGNDEPPASLPF